MFHLTCKKGKGRALRSYTVIVSMAAVILVPVLFLSSCGLLLPTPTNEQIMEAVKTFNESGEEPLDLDYGEMKVPQRLPGKALAILWVPDKSIQRNFSVVYDRGEQIFHVESYSTQMLGEDGVYRDVNSD